MPTPRRCSGCGAALGEPTDDDLTILCGFCGLRHDINAVAGGGATPVVVQVGGPRRTGGHRLLLAVLLVFTAAIGVSLYVAFNATTELTTRVLDTTAAGRDRVAEPSRPVAVPVAALRTLSDRGWKTVATTPPGGYDAFDPVAALPWAMEVAQAWAPDAVLTRIDVGRVSTTGVVDVSGDTPSGYRFHSPARTLRWKQEADAGATRTTTTTSMMMQVQGGAVKVLVDSDGRRDEPKTSAPVSLALPDLLERAKQSRGFSDRPFYAAYMIFLPREGWAWYFRAPSGDSFPRVRARDGRVWPY